MSRIARNLPPQEVLQHFTDLTSLDVAVRTTATTSLLRHLHPLHVSHEAPAAATASLATAESRPIPSDLRGSARDAAIKAHASDLVTAFMATLHPHVAYAYMRLVKGLPSSSKAARQGFSAALAFLLRLIRARWQYLHAAVHVYIVAVPGTNNAQDERDKLYGRLFAAVAAIESGMHKVVDGGMSEAQVHELASMLGFVAESKEYLREAAYSVAFRLADETRHAQAAMTALRSALPAELTRVDHLALSVYLESRGASVPTPLTAASLSPSSNVSDLLLQSTSVAPRMHLVWTVLLAHVLQSPKLHLPATPGLLAAATLTRIDAGTTDLPLLAPTWRAIDRTLLTSGPARAAQALHVFAFLFRVAPVEQLPALLTPNLLRVLEKTRRGPLRTHVTRAVRVIVTAALDDRRVVPIVLAAVKPSILESLRAPSRDADDSDDSDSDSDDEYDSDVSDDEDESDDEEEEDAEDESAPPVYEQLLANLTDSDLTQFIESLIEQARSLSDAGNVEDPKSVAAMYALETLLNPALAPRGAAAIAQYLFSPAHMAAAPNATARTHTFLARAAPVPESPVGLKALTDVYLAFPGKDARVAKWVKKPIAATVTAAAGGDSERAGRAARRETAARALVMAAHLVLATDAETAARATETVDEVVSVWQKYTKATAAATGGEAEIDPLDVLADVALELTANPVSWLRRLCSQSVAAFADSMTENVLALMLEALDANHADDDDEDEEKDAMDQSEDDEWESDADEENAMDVDEKPAASSDDDDEEEEEGTTSTRNQQLSNAITQALRTSGMAANGDGNGNDESDNESDLDDEAMLALDAVLGAMVRKQSSRTQQTERLHFQYRVADLVGVYLKHRTSAPLAHMRALADKLASLTDRPLATKLWHAAAGVKRIDLAGADAGEADALATLFLRGDLAAAHPVLLKQFKAAPPSPVIVDLMLADPKRYKSVLAALARTLPTSCAPIFAGALAKLNRKSAKALAPVIQPLVERVPVTSVLQPALRDAAPVLSAALADELKSNPKDTALLKLLVAAVRAAAKASLDLAPYKTAVASVSQLPTKQAALGLMREVGKLVGAEVAPSAKAVKSAKQPVAAAPVAAPVAAAPAAATGKKAKKSSK